MLWKGICQKFPCKVHSLQADVLQGVSQKLLEELSLVLGSVPADLDLVSELIFKLVDFTLQFAVLVHQRSYEEPLQFGEVLVFVQQPPLLPSVIIVEMDAEYPLKSLTAANRKRGILILQVQGVYEDLGRLFVLDAFDSGNGSHSGGFGDSWVQLKNDSTQLVKDLGAIVGYS